MLLTKQKKLTIQSPSPLALSSGVLSVDLSGYQKTFAVFPPLSMTETTLRSEGVTIVVPTLVIDMSDYLTTSSPYAYQPYLTVLPPLKLEDSLLSFDESRFQMKFPASLPDLGQVQLWDAVTGAFKALAVAGGLVLTSSVNGR